LNLANYLKLKEFIKYRIIRTQDEWENHIDNIFRLFDKYQVSFIPENILDIGCGKGDRTIRLADYFKIQRDSTYGLDCNDDFINACKSKFNVKKIDLETEEIPYDNNTFDLVICNQVLEHLKNYKNVIDGLIRVTVKGGYIVIGIPNLAHLINRIYLLFGIQPMCIHLDSSHVRGFTHRDFKKMLISLQRVKLIDCSGSLMYPLPFFITKYIADYFIGLNGYVCYLLKRLE